MNFAAPALASAVLLLGAAAAHAQSAADYVRLAGASDKFEITEAHIAQTHSHNPRVLQAARMMVRDHANSTAQIQAAVRGVAGHNPPPAQLSPEQRRMAADLRRAPPRAFDRLYVAQQVQSHQQALELQSGYARHGDAPELRRTAQTIVPVVQQHLDMWRDLQGRMG